MSDFTKGAIFRRIQSDNILKTMLAVDPNPNSGGQAAVFNAWKGGAPKALPQLLFMQVGDTDEDLMDQSRGQSGIWRETWHFQAWAKSRNDIPQQIIEHIKRLFHNQRFALDGGAKLLECMKTGGDPEGFDEDLDEAFSLAIYQLKYVV